jgi:hypothetical protein
MRMRKLLGLLTVALLFTAVGWLLGTRFGKPIESSNDKPTESGTGSLASAVEYDVKFARASGLSRVLEINKQRMEVQEAPDTTRKISRVEFGGKTFWVVLWRTGMGISYYTVGLYAPAEDGQYHLCMEAESCGAGYIKPELDEATGLLVVREHARSKLEGQVILSCNLRSVGNYHSVYGK